MPSSMHQNISMMVEEIIRTNPKTILDIGIGFGKYGFLAREFLETHYDKVYPEQWKVKIDGVEIWDRYVEKFCWLKKFYNQVYIGDICDLVDKLGDYELIIAGDVIEHIEKKKATILLGKLLNKSIKKFLLSIPLGDWTGNMIADNNPYEKHLSIWSAKELIALLDKPIKTYRFKGTRGNVGVFIYEKRDKCYEKN